MATLNAVLARWLALPSIVQTGVKVLAVVVVGYLLLWVLRKYVITAMRKSPRSDKTLVSFLSKTITAGGWLVLVMAALVTAGVDVTALAGGLAVGGFVIGFALKDTLGNLAAGVMLLFYRPFNVGDTVTVEGHDGEVMSLGMSLTTVRAGDGRIISIPNGRVLGNAIVNHTRMERRRADVAVGIAYDDDIDAAVKAILEALDQDERVLKEPAPSVRITALADSSVGLQVRPWVPTKDFWQAKADFHKTVKLAVEQAGCNIPFPQRTVHMVNG